MHMERSTVEGVACIWKSVHEGGEGEDVCIWKGWNVLHVYRERGSCACINWRVCMGKEEKCTCGKGEGRICVWKD